MNKLELKQRLNLLNSLLKVNKVDRKQFIENCPNDCIHALCEACFNLLHNNFQLNQAIIRKIKNKLKYIKEDFKKLSNEKIALKTKRKILVKPQVGNGIFSLLATTLIPALISLIKK